MSIERFKEFVKDGEAKRGAVLKALAITPNNLQRAQRPVDASWTSKLGATHTNPESFASQNKLGASAWIHPNGNIISAPRMFNGRPIPGVGSHQESAANAGMTPDAVVRSGMVRFNYMPQNGTYKGSLAVESGAPLTSQQLKTIKNLHAHAEFTPFYHDIHYGGRGPLHGGPSEDTKPYEADLRRLGQHPSSPVSKAIRSPILPGPKITKGKANHKEGAPEKCCGTCGYFDHLNACSRVYGLIKADDVCKIWSQHQPDAGDNAVKDHPEDGPTADPVKDKMAMAKKQDSKSPKVSVEINPPFGGSYSGAKHPGTLSLSEFKQEHGKDGEKPHVLILRHKQCVKDAIDRKLPIHEDTKEREASAGGPEPPRMAMILMIMGKPGGPLEQARDAKPKKSKIEKAVSPGKMKQLLAILTDHHTAHAAECHDRHDPVGESFHNGAYQGVESVRHSELPQEDPSTKDEHFRIGHAIGKKTADLLSISPKAREIVENTHPREIEKSVSGEKRLHAAIEASRAFHEMLSKPEDDKSEVAARSARWHAGCAHGISAGQKYLKTGAEPHAIVHMVRDLYFGDPGEYPDGYGTGLGVVARHLGGEDGAEKGGETEKSMDDEDEIEKAEEFNLDTAGEDEEKSLGAPSVPAVASPVKPMKPTAPIEKAYNAEAARRGAVINDLSIDQRQSDKNSNLAPATTTAPSLATPQIAKSHISFSDMVSKLKSEGKDDASARKIAASIAVKKYGKKRVERAAKEGKPVTEEKGMDGGASPELIEMGAKEMPGVPEPGV